MSIAEDFVVAINADEGGHEDVIYDLVQDQDYTLPDEVVSRDILDTGRWDIVLRSVYRCTDDSYFAVVWNEGATEYQDSTEPNAKAHVVVPKTIEQTVYVRP